ncbi:MAG: TlpA family protein disulfide reductase [Lachnospiraceae bacterium]|nr:TlpA family protein disulfide reductase [Lachnospiraceae bacterium]
MNKYLKTVLIVLLLVVVIGGAGIGYNYLSKNYKDKQKDEKTSVETTTEEITEDNKIENTDDNTVGKSETEAAAKEGNKEDKTEAGSGSDEQAATAPDFKFLNMDGEEVHLSDYFGKPVVLNFWATWCGPCQMEMPYFDTAYKKYSEDINFLFIDLTDGSRDTVESAKAFVDDKGFSFPIGFDTEYDGAYTYAVSSIPMTFFIDKDGVIQAYQIGTIDEGVLNEQLELLVK